MECRLHESDSRERALVCTVDHSSHQHAPHGPILHVRHDRDRPYSGDYRTLVQTITSHNLAIDLCDDAIETRVSKEYLEKANADFSRGDVGWKSMLFVDC